MVTQIYDTKQLEKEFDRNEFAITLTLSKENIQKWKEEGYFAFLKKELIQIYGIKFSCTSLEDGRCIYIFLPETKALQDRIFTLIKELRYSDKKIPLVKCGISNADIFNSHPTMEGTITACPLF